MLKLLAIAAGDGWAFAGDNGTVFLVKPPYQKDGLVKVTSDALAAAVERYGFSKMDKDFDGWRSLIDFLKDELIRSRRELGQKIEIEKIRDLINFAPPEILQKYLDRIESELLPGGEFRAASAVLERLLRLDKVKQDPSLKEKTEGLLKNCQVQEALKAKGLRELVDPEAEIRQKYPSLIKRFNPGDVYTKAQSVMKKGQLLSLGH